MKKKTVLGLSIACCALAFACALAVTDAPSYSASATDDGIKMVEGASVRLSTENDDVAVNGIRFATQMTKAKYESLTGTEVILTSTATANGVTKTASWVLKSANAQNVSKITFKDDVVTFYHTITFDSLFGAENADKLRVANAWDFTVNYSLNSDNDAEDWTSETVTRSMRQVAYTAYTTPSTEEEPNAGYENATLLNYFTLSNEKKVYYSNGVEDTTSVGNVTGLKAYANDADGKLVDISNTKVNTLYGESATVGAKAEAVAFDENNVAYNTTVQSATMLYTADDVKKLLDVETTTTVKGYYALANDITVNKWASNINARKLTFAGIFDGNGHKLTVPMRVRGLFGVMQGQVKNTWLEFTNVKAYAGYGEDVLLAYTCTSQFKVGTEVCNTFENLYITIDKATFGKNADGTNGSSLTEFAWIYFVDSTIKMQNIIADYSDLLSEKYTGSYYGYGLLAQKYNSGDATSEETNFWHNASYFTDIYFISPNLKHVSNYVYDRYARTYTVKTLYATNDTANMQTDLTAWQEEDASEGKQVTYAQYVATDMYRYDNWTAFDGAENKDFSSFPSEYWNVQNNQIRWKGNAFNYNEQLVKTTIDGEEASEGVLISDVNSAQNTASVSVLYDEAQANIISVTAIEGAELITINGAVVSAVAGKTGNAMVSITYKVSNDNVMRTTTVAFEVSAFEVSNEVLLWSSNRDCLYQSENFGTITKITNLADDSVLYDGTTYTTATLDNATNAPITFDVLVERENATTVKMALKSYTDYFSEAEELSAVFDVSDGNNKVTIANNTCYVLANDINITAWKKSGYHQTFAGVFDGNGYKLTLPMRAAGLFGTLHGQVKNTWFHFTNVRWVDASYANTNNLLAKTAQQQFKVGTTLCNTLENLYITIDKETFNKNPDGTASTKAFGNFALIEAIDVSIKMQNVIVDYADLLVEEFSGNHGLFAQRYSSASTAYWQAMPNFTDIYFISSGLKLLTKYSTSVVAYANNDEGSVEEGVSYSQYVATDIYRYDDWDKFDKAGRTFASFAPEYWTVTNNTIRWNVK